MTGNQRDETRESLMSANLGLFRAPVHQSIKQMKKTLDMDRNYAFADRRT
jgi:hypothetical protein